MERKIENEQIVKDGLGSNYNRFSFLLVPANMIHEYRLVLYPSSYLGVGHGGALPNPWSSVVVKQTHWTKVRALRSFSQPNEIYSVITRRTNQAPVRSVSPMSRFSDGAISLGGATKNSQRFVYILHTPSPQRP